MSTRNLDKMMVPKSVVAIGASVRPESVGAAVTRNLLTGGFKGDIHLVNVKGGTIEGRPVLKSVAELREPADLAVIMTPAETVPRLIFELGERGTKVAVVITAGTGSGVTAREDNARWRRRILRARRHRQRRAHAQRNDRHPHVSDLIWPHGWYLNSSLRKFRNWQLRRRLRR